MIGYTSTQREYQIWGPEQRCIFAQTAVIFDRTKNGVHLLDEYSFIAMPILSANLLPN